MQSALRPYATAGVAIVGASLIAVTPVATPLSDIYTARDVELTAGGALFDFLAPFVDQFNISQENATTLINNFFLAPHVALQQMLVNHADYAQQLFNDPANITTVTQQMQENLAAVLTGLPLANASSSTVTDVVYHTLSGGSVSEFLATGNISHYGLFELLPLFLPANVSATATPIIDFLSSPVSGLIIGNLGPLISPWVGLLNSVSAGDSLTETLANTMGAFFNGATLNLDGLVPLIAQAGVLPAGISLTNLDFAFGGLLTPGDVAVGPYEMYNSAGDLVASVPAVGGSIFNSIGLSLGGVPILGSLNAVAEPIGPIGAWEGMQQTIGALIGSGWDGKGAVSVSPPLAGITLPIIPTDLADVGGTGSAAAVDMAGLVQDIVAALG